MYNSKSRKDAHLVDLETKLRELETEHYNYIDALRESCKHEFLFVREDANKLAEDEEYWMTIIYCPRCTALFSGAHEPQELARILHSAEEIKTVSSSELEELSGSFFDW